MAEKGEGAKNDRKKNAARLFFRKQRPKVREGLLDRNQRGKGKLGMLKNPTPT